MAINRSSVLVALVLTFEPSLTHAQTEQPNVVVMMVDNTGWGELGVYGGGALRGAPTPRLEALTS